MMEEVALESADADGHQDATSKTLAVIHRINTLVNAIFGLSSIHATFPLLHVILYRLFAFLPTLQAVEDNVPAKQGKGDCVDILAALEGVLESLVFHVQRAAALSVFHEGPDHQEQQHIGTKLAWCIEALSTAVGLGHCRGAPGLPWDYPIRHHSEQYCLAAMKTMYSTLTSMHTPCKVLWLSGSEGPSQVNIARYLGQFLLCHRLASKFIPLRLGIPLSRSAGGKYFEFDAISLQYQILTALGVRPPSHLSLPVFNDMYTSALAGRQVVVMVDCAPPFPPEECFKQLHDPPDTNEHSMLLKQILPDPLIHLVPGQLPQGSQVTIVLCSCQQDCPQADACWATGQHMYVDHSHGVSFSCCSIPGTSPDAVSDLVRAVRRDTSAPAAADAHRDGDVYWESPQADFVPSDSVSGTQAKILALSKRCKGSQMLVTFLAHMLCRHEALVVDILDTLQPCSGSVATPVVYLGQQPQFSEKHSHLEVGTVEPLYHGKEEPLQHVVGVVLNNLLPMLPTHVSRLLVQLALFPACFTPHAAASILGMPYTAVTRSLHQLCACGLVHMRPMPQSGPCQHPCYLFEVRFELDPLVWQWCRSALRDHILACPHLDGSSSAGPQDCGASDAPAAVLHGTDAHIIRNRFCGYYLGLMHQAHEEISLLQGHSAAGMFLSERLNIRMAVSMASLSCNRLMLNRLLIKNLALEHKLVVLCPQDYPWPCTAINPCAKCSAVTPSVASICSGCHHTYPQSVQSASDADHIPEQWRRESGSLCPTLAMLSKIIQELYDEELCLTKFGCSTCAGGTCSTQVHAVFSDIMFSPDHFQDRGSDAILPTEGNCISCSSPTPSSSNHPPNAAPPAPAHCCFCWSASSDTSTAEAIPCSISHYYPSISISARMACSSFPSANIEDARAMLICLRAEAYDLMSAVWESISNTSDCVFPALSAPSVPPEFPLTSDSCDTPHFPCDACCRTYIPTYPWDHNPLSRAYAASKAAYGLRQQLHQFHHTGCASDHSCTSDARFANPSLQSCLELIQITPMVPLPPLRKSTPSVSVQESDPRLHSLPHLHKGTFLRWTEQGPAPPGAASLLISCMTPPDGSWIIVPSAKPWQYYPAGWTAWAWKYGCINTLLQMASVLVGLGKHHRAKSILHKSYKFCMTGGKAGTLFDASLLATISRPLVKIGCPWVAASSMTRSLSALQRSAIQDPHTVGKCLCLLADALHHLGYYSEVHSLVSKAIAVLGWPYVHALVAAGVSLVQSSAVWPQAQSVHLKKLSVNLLVANRRVKSGSLAPQLNLSCCFVLPTLVASDSLVSPDGNTVQAAQVSWLLSHSHGQASSAAMPLAGSSFNSRGIEGHICDPFSLASALLVQSKCLLADGHARSAVASASQSRKVLQNFVDHLERHSLSLECIVQLAVASCADAKSHHLLSFALSLLRRAYFCASALFCHPSVVHVKLQEARLLSQMGHHSAASLLCQHVLWHQLLREHVPGAEKVQLPKTVAQCSLSCDGDISTCDLSLEKLLLVLFLERQQHSRPMRDCVLERSVGILSGVDAHGVHLANTKSSCLSIAGGRSGINLWVQPLVISEITLCLSEVCSSAGNTQGAFQWSFHSVSIYKQAFSFLCANPAPNIGHDEADLQKVLQPAGNIDASGHGAHDSEAPPLPLTSLNLNDMLAEMESVQSVSLGPIQEDGQLAPPDIYDQMAGEQNSPVFSRMPSSYGSTESRLDPNIPAQCYNCWPNPALGFPLESSISTPASSIAPSVAASASAVNLICTSDYKKGGMPIHGPILKCLAQFSRAALAADLIDVAEAAAQDSVAVATMLYGESHVVVCNHREVQSNVLVRQGKLQEAEELLRESFCILRNVHISESRIQCPELSCELVVHPEIAGSLSKLGQVLYLMQRYDECLVYFSVSLNIFEQLYGVQSIHYAGGLLHVGNTHYRMGEMKKAESLYREQLAISRNVFYALHPTIPRVLTNLAVVLDRLQQYSEAEWLYREALSLKEKSCNDRLAVATAVQNLAFCYYHQHKWVQALECFKKCLALRQQAGLASVNPMVYTTANWILHVQELAELPVSQSSAVGELCGGVTAASSVAADTISMLGNLSTSLYSMVSKRH